MQLDCERDGVALREWVLHVDYDLPEELDWTLAAQLTDFPGCRSGSENGMGSLNF